MHTLQLSPQPDSTAHQAHFRRDERATLDTSRCPPGYQVGYPTLPYPYPPACTQCHARSQLHGSSTAGDGGHCGMQSFAHACAALSSQHNCSNSTRVTQKTQVTQGTVTYPMLPYPTCKQVAHPWSRARPGSARATCCTSSGETHSPPAAHGWGAGSAAAAATRRPAHRSQATQKGESRARPQPTQAPRSCTAQMQSMHEVRGGRHSRAHPEQESCTSDAHHWRIASSHVIPYPSGTNNNKPDTCSRTPWDPRRRRR